MEGIKLLLSIAWLPTQELKSTAVAMIGQWLHQKCMTLNGH